MSLTDAAQDHAFTAGLTDFQAARLSAISYAVEFEENELVLQARQRSRNFYLLVSGSVCVEVVTRSFIVRVQALGPGDAFGWSALLDHHDTLFQVRAREKSTALCMDGEQLTAMLAKDPEFAAEMLRRTLKVVAGRVQATEARLGELCGVRIPRMDETQKGPSR